MADYRATHAAIEAVWRIESPRLVAALARISTAGQRGVGMAVAGISLAMLGTFGPVFGIFFMR